MADEPDVRPPRPPPTAAGAAAAERRRGRAAGQRGLRARDHRLRLSLLRLRGRRPGRQHAPAVPDQHPHDQAALHRQARGHPPAQGARGRRRRRLRRRLPRGRVPLPQGQPLGQEAGGLRQEAARRDRRRARRVEMYNMSSAMGAAVRRGRAPSSRRASAALGPNPVRPREGFTAARRRAPAMGGVAMPDDAGIDHPRLMTAVFVEEGHVRDDHSRTQTLRRDPTRIDRRARQGAGGRLRHLRRGLPHRRREGGRDPGQPSCASRPSKTAATCRSSTRPPSASASGSTSTRSPPRSRSTPTGAQHGLRHRHPVAWPRSSRPSSSCRPSTPTCWACPRSTPSGSSAAAPAATA